MSAGPAVRTGSAGAGPAAVGTTAVSADVHGVHGAAGRTRWKAFAGRRQLRSPVEAVEWASIPPGGVSGEHRHTRTEEMYLILSGTGELLLNGVAHPVRAGMLALTGIGNIHGLRNTGVTDLDWWVIETLPPVTTAVLTGSRSPLGGCPVSNAAVFDLFAQRRVDTAGIFSGPLKRIEYVEVPAGGRETLGSPDAELAVYVHSGTGTAHSNAADDVALTTDTCLLVPAGSRITVSATADLRFSAVTLRLPANEADR
jgi:mannose-6-phosphate isomerase-like protein (cupin superfamily)